MAKGTLHIEGDGTVAYDKGEIALQPGRRILDYIVFVREKSRRCPDYAPQHYAY